MDGTFLHRLQLMEQRLQTLEHMEQRVEQLEGLEKLQHRLLEQQHEQREIEQERIMDLEEEHANRMLEMEARICAIEEEWIHERVADGRLVKGAYGKGLEFGSNGKIRKEFGSKGKNIGKGSEFGKGTEFGKNIEFGNVSRDDFTLGKGMGMGMGNVAQAKGVLEHQGKNTR
jgi:hypothetical protein